MARVELLPDAELQAKRDAAEAAGDWPLMERCEAEMERREDTDPLANPVQDDTPSLDMPGGYGS